MTLAIEIKREINGKTHKTHLKENCIMHLDIIEKLVDKALRLHVKAELIEKVFDNGYKAIK